MKNSVSETDENIKPIAELNIDESFENSLKENGLIEVFKALDYTQKQQQVDWINSAKESAVKAERIKKAIDKIKSTL